MHFPITLIKNVLLEFIQFLNLQLVIKICGEDQQLLNRSRRISVCPLASHHDVWNSRWSIRVVVVFDDRPHHGREYS